MTQIRIDNTQYSSFTRCPLYWVEQYVNCVRKPFKGQRDDALAIGVAVHDALYHGYKSGSFTVNPKVMEELNLTHEASMEVRSMVEAYRSAYPSGPVELPWTGLEDPLEYQYNNQITLVAKLDGHCHVKEPIEIEGGNGTIYLEPGVYAFETKTKRPGYDRGLYIAEWQAAMQASFQTITLRANAARFGFTPDDVKGVIVNVIERPNVYEPRRTCLGCDKMFQVRLYGQDGKQYRCPGCGYLNTFRGPMGTARVDPPYMWRFAVYRSPERLATDLQTIAQVADAMMAARISDSPVAHRTNCVNVQWRKRCDFYEPHNAVFPVKAIEWAGYEKFNPTAYLEKEEADGRDA